MLMFELPKTEANVVIVVTHSEGCGMVMPFWECDSTTAQLHETAAISALELVEKVGGGHATYMIHDRRPVQG